MSGRGGDWPGAAGRGGAGAGAASPGLRVALLHDHEHRPRLLRGDQVVQDEAHAPLIRPAGLVLAAPVLEVEDGIARLAIGVVAGRGVDEDAPPDLDRLREVPSLADLAVRHVLRQVVVDALLGHFDPARILARAVERPARGVVHLHAVDPHPVVVEAGDYGVGRRGGPEAILVLGRGVPRVIEEPELDLLRIRGLDAERDAQVVVDPRILGPADVRGRGGALGRSRVLGRCEEQADEPQGVHRGVSLRGGVGTTRDVRRVGLLIRSLRRSPPGRSARSGRCPSPARCGRSSPSSSGRPSGSGPAGRRACRRASSPARPSRR